MIQTVKLINLASGAKILKETPQHLRSEVNAVENLTSTSVVG